MPFTLHLFQDDGLEPYIFPNAFKDEICKEKSWKLYRKVLKEKGIMLTYRDGKDIRYTINEKRIRMVTLCFG